MKPKRANRRQKRKLSRVVEVISDDKELTKLVEKALATQVSNRLDGGKGEK